MSAYFYIVRMKVPMSILHAACVNQAKIETNFSSDRRHRYSLKLPFHGRTTGKSLIIVGQNPSEANESIADKTIEYLERLVHSTLPQYDEILMLNLYTRMDTNKTKDDVLDNLSDLEFRRSLTAGSDALLIFGRLKNERAYRFKDRANALREDLQKANLYKLAINTDYAPHPGNPKILYSKLDVGIDEYRFGDL